MANTLAQKALENGSANIQSATQFTIPAEFEPKMFDIEVAITQELMDSNPEKKLEFDALIQEINQSIESGEHPELSELKPFTQVSELVQFATDNDPKKTEIYKMLSNLSVTNFDDGSSIVWSNDNEGNPTAAVTETANLTELNEQKVRKLHSLANDEMKPVSSFQSPQQAVANQVENKNAMRLRI